MSMQAIHDSNLGRRRRRSRGRRHCHSLGVPHLERVIIGAGPDLGRRAAVRNLAIRQVEALSMVGPRKPECRMYLEEAIFIQHPTTG
jgi:hypothetical protein